MNTKEAKARIKINNLLEQSGWQFFDSAKGKANISLEHRTKKGKFTNDKLGNDLENAPDGFIDYLLLNEQSRPVALVEAKRESIDPLTAKEQARDYARGQNIRHIFLSNGNVHYYWDLEQGNPTVISRFLSLKQLGEAGRWQPNPEKMKSIGVTADYIALSQDAKWRSYSEAEQKDALVNKGVRLLRGYQIEAAKVLQNAGPPVAPRGRPHDRDGPGPHQRPEPVGVQARCGGRAHWSNLYGPSRSAKNAFIPSARSTRSISSFCGSP